VKRKDTDVHLPTGLGGQLESATSFSTVAVRRGTLLLLLWLWFLSLLVPGKQRVRLA